MTRVAPMHNGHALVDVLVLDGLNKSFGALKVTDNVSLTVRPGEVHALIGPNGAGKSTLIGQISGELRSDSGEIRLMGRDVTAMKPWHRARIGLARSFQITQLCLEYTAMEQVLLALDTRQGGSFNVFTNPRRNKAMRDEAAFWIGRVGLTGRENDAIENLAHGERRQLELAVALSRDHHVLVLDEPMAGLGAEESTKMVELLSELKGEVPMLLVEHDMDAVFTLADRISVLVYGKVIATGSVDHIRNDPQVRAAYLGDDA